MRFNCLLFSSFLLLNCGAPTRPAAQLNTPKTASPLIADTVMPKVRIIRDSMVLAKRNVGNKTLDIAMFVRKEQWTDAAVLWEESGEDDIYKKNTIQQLNPNTLFYNWYPKEFTKNNLVYSQPTTLEFLDDEHKTIRKVDIWHNRPYQNIYNVKFADTLIGDFGDLVIPYSHQLKKIKPVKYCTNTSLKASNGFILVIYEKKLYGKKVGMGDIDYLIGLEYTLRAFNNKGYVIAEVSKIPTFDGGEITKDGKYLVYTVGGWEANENAPFRTMDRIGFCIMNLQTQKNIYQEYLEDIEKRENEPMFFQGAMLEGNGIRITYSYPRNNLLADDEQYFDPQNLRLYRKKFTNIEWAQLVKEYETLNSPDWMYFVEKYNFQKIDLVEN